MKDENVLKMEKCPRFQSCSIPKCPLDEDMDKRLELLEDEICPLRRRLGRMLRKRVPGRLAFNWRKLAQYVPSCNLKNPETTQTSPQEG